MRQTRKCAFCGKEFTSDMEGEDGSVSVDENDGGFSIGGNEYEKILSSP